VDLPQPKKQYPYPYWEGDVIAMPAPTR